MIEQSHEEHKKSQANAKYLLFIMAKYQQSINLLCPQPNIIN